jgi:histidinol-phosphate aminotransferase
MKTLIDRRGALLLGTAALGSTVLAKPSAKPAPALQFPIRISGNENPYGPSPMARAAMAANMNDACRYAGRQFSELLEKLQKLEQVGKGQIALGSGSGELLNMLAIAFCDRGELVCGWPSFEFIMSYAAKLGCEVRKVPLNAALIHDLPAIAAATSANTSLVYVCNPNNPTGTVVDAASLRQFCREQSQRSLVVVDEAYLDLVDDGATESMVDLVREGANMVILRTFSKIHGLAGMRIGYAVARADVAARLRRFSTTIPNILGLAAASASLDDSQFLATTRKALLADRQRLTSLCDELNIRYAKPQGNFVFVKVGMPSTEFSKAMAAEKIEVSRPFDLYPDWNRISIGTRAEMDFVLPVLRRIIRA